MSKPIPQRDHPDINRSKREEHEPNDEPQNIYEIDENEENIRR